MEEKNTVEEKEPEATRHATSRGAGCGGRFFERKGAAGPSQGREWQKKNFFKVCGRRTSIRGQGSKQGLR